jgi:hypothetical protein
MVQGSDISKYAIHAVNAVSAVSAVSAASVSAVPVSAASASPTHIPHIRHIPYKGAIDCFVRICREEGVRGLFNGLGANMVRGVAGALLLVAYDELKGVIKIR